MAPVARTWLLVSLSLTCSSQVRVSQYERVSASAGSSAVLGCFVEGEEIQDFSIQWFQQKPGSPPSHILRHGNDSNIHRGDAFPERFQPARNSSSSAFPERFQPARNSSSSAFPERFQPARNSSSSAFLERFQPARNSSSNAFPERFQPARNSSSSAFPERFQPARNSSSNAFLERFQQARNSSSSAFPERFQPARNSSSSAFPERFQPARNSSSSAFPERFQPARNSSSRAFPERFQPARNSSSNAYFLQITALTTGDSAQYWCLLVKDPGLPVWGGGTRLSVFGGPGVLTPSVTLLSSTGTPSGSSTFYVMCLVNNFYPAVIEVTWKMDGRKATWDITGQPFLDGDNSYSMSSVLEIRAHPGRNRSSVSCEVRHDSSRTLISKDLSDC
ncbi:uncharacterized protein LOC142475286 [Ascaphus truei]|uniref:uncharacterized protein LOC142475286 n=1 Tax=Ascaphus truei TaxID=8439 RepID=UPI003F5A905E